jgi:hypothetical protein
MNASFTEWQLYLKEASASALANPDESQIAVLISAQSDL